MTEEIKDNNVAESIEAEAEDSYSASMKAKEQGHRRILRVASITLAISMAMALWLRFGLNYGGTATDTAQVESVDSLDTSEEPDTDPKEDMLNGIVTAVVLTFIISLIVCLYELDMLTWPYRYNEITRWYGKK